MESIQADLFALSAAGLLVATFGVVLRRSLVGWVSAYRYQSVVLAGSAGIIGYYTGYWEVYVAAVMTVVVKVVIIPRLLVRVTSNLEQGLLIEANPYVSIRVSLLVSAVLVALSYGIAKEALPLQVLGQEAEAYLPVSLSLFFVGLFMMVSRRTALNQVVGLLVIENGLFLFTSALTQGHGVSLTIETGILADALLGVMIAGILLGRMSETFDTLDVSALEKLKDD